MENYRIIAVRPCPIHHADYLRRLVNSLNAQIRRDDTINKRKILVKTK